jgi:L-ascorbate metabolism protein UlaG (beta-lactamase superfamily)
MSGLTITRVAHSCVLIDFDGATILTDPWFSEKRGYHRGESLGVEIGELEVNRLRVKELIVEQREERA